MCAHWAETIQNCPNAKLFSLHWVIIAKNVSKHFYENTYKETFNEIEFYSKFNNNWLFFNVCNFVQWYSILSTFRTIPDYVKVGHIIPMPAQIAPMILPGMPHSRPSTLEHTGLVIAKCEKL